MKGFSMQKMVLSGEKVKILFRLENYLKRIWLKFSSGHRNGE